MGQIMTLEGLGGSRSCLQVKKGTGGQCQCAAFGPPGSARLDFKKLCAESGLSPKIGQKINKSKEENNVGQMDFPPIGDLEDVGFLNNLLDPEMIKESLVAVGGAAVTTVAYTELVNRVGAVGDKAWKRMLLSAVIGFGGGRLLWDRNRSLAYGVMSAMGSQLGMEVWGQVQIHLLKQGTKNAADAIKAMQEAAGAGAGTNGLNAFGNDLALSMGDVLIDESDDLTRGESHRRAFADVSVEEEQEFASMLAAVA